MICEPTELENHDYFTMHRFELSPITMIASVRHWRAMSAACRDVCALHGLTRNRIRMMLASISETA